MSVTAAFEALSDVLYLTDPAPEDGFREGCVLVGPPEGLTVADFPTAVICLTPGQQHNWTEEAMGLARHDYSATIYVILGIRQTPLSELQARSLPWPEAIARVLVSHLTLNGTVNQIGYGGDPKITSYTLGPIPWGMSNEGTLLYWGLTFTLPIIEKPNMEMSA